jgi:DNA-binding transcriptional ArsR family regulator
MLETLPSPEFCAQAAQVAELLKLMGNPQRLLIACLLAEGECAVSEIEARTGIRQPSLSQHLGALREAGVIQGRRAAKAVIYHLADARAAALLDALKRIFAPSDNPVPRPAAKPVQARSQFSASGVAAFARLQPGENAG